MSMEKVDVEAGEWLSHHRELHAHGFSYFDFLAATDLGDGTIEIVAHVLSPESRDRVMSRAVVSAVVESLASLYPAANWHEREGMELVGVEFSGHPDPRPLVLAQAYPRRPLRRETPLAARVSQPWPGLYEPGAEEGTTRRRRPKPVPGVNPDWLEQ